MTFAPMIQPLNTIKIDQAQLFIGKRQKLWRDLVKMHSENQTDSKTTLHHLVKRRMDVAFKRLFIQRKVSLAIIPENPFVLEMQGWLYNKM